MIPRRWIRRRPWGLLAATGAAALLLTCGAGTTESPRRLFGAERTATPVPTPTLSAARQDQLLDQGFASPELGFFIRQPAGWSGAADQGGGVAVRFANTVADSDGGRAVFASLLVAVDDTSPPAAVDINGYLRATVENAPDRFAAQFDQFTLIEATVDKGGRAPMAVVEFAYRDANGSRLHAVRALVPAATRVFVVLGTALEAAWPAHEPAIRASLASFTVLSG